MEWDINEPPSDTNALFIGDNGREDVFAAVYRGWPIACTEEQYPQVRQWLTECREFWDSEGRGLISFIAQNEIKRLDQLFEVSERQA